MALVFGLAELRSRISEWRSERRSAGQRGRLNLPFADMLRTSGPVAGDDPEISFMIEHQVIPLLAQTAGVPCAGPRTVAEPDAVGAPDREETTPAPAIADQDVVRFAALSVDADTGTLMDFVDARIAAGLSIDSVLVDLLAPAARLLGRYWEDDSRDFVDVTMGLWRIQEVLRQVTALAPPSRRGGKIQRRILMSTMPGDQHSFGTLMVAEQFQRSGWYVDVLVDPTRSELHEKIAGSPYDVTGLTLSCDCPTATVRSLVSTIRAVSRNPEIRILIGGRNVNERPALVEEVGADGSAVDAAGAVALAEHLVAGVDAHAADMI